MIKVLLLLNVRIYTTRKCMCDTPVFTDYINTLIYQSSIIKKKNNGDTLSERKGQKIIFASSILSMR